MSHGDAKWANAVGKMPRVDLHDTGRLATNLLSVKSSVSAEQDKQDMLVLHYVAARHQPLCRQDREPCPPPTLFWGGGAGLPRRAHGILVWVLFQGARAGVPPGVAGCLTYRSAGKSRIPRCFPGAREGVEGCSCFSTAAYFKRL